MSETAIFPSLWHPHAMSSPERLTARKLALRLPRDRAFQSGLRLGVFGPVLSFAVGVFLLPAISGDPETGLAWGLLHVAAFGLIEAVWIVPLALLSTLLRFKRFALGLAVAGSLLLVANGLAWLGGLAIGAR